MRLYAVLAAALCKGSLQRFTAVCLRGLCFCVSSKTGGLRNGCGLKMSFCLPRAACFPWNVRKRRRLAAHNCWKTLWTAGGTGCWSYDQSPHLHSLNSGRSSDAGVRGSLAPIPPAMICVLLPDGDSRHWQNEDGSAAAVLRSAARGLAGRTCFHA